MGRTDASEGSVPSMLPSRPFLAEDAQESCVWSSCPLWMDVSAHELQEVQEDRSDSLWRTNAFNADERDEEDGASTKLLDMGTVVAAMARLVAPKARVSWQPNSLFSGERLGVVGEEAMQPTLLIPIEAALRAKQSCTSQDLECFTCGSDNEEQEDSRAAGLATAYLSGAFCSRSGTNSVSGTFAEDDSCRRSQVEAADLEGFENRVHVPATPRQDVPDVRFISRSESGQGRAVSAHPAPAFMEFMAKDTTSTAGLLQPTSADICIQDEPVDVKTMIASMRCVSSQPDLRKAAVGSSTRAEASAEACAGAAASCEPRRRNSAASRPCQAWNAAPAPSGREQKLVLVQARQSKPSVKAKKQEQPAVAPQACARVAPAHTHGCGQLQDIDSSGQARKPQQPALPPPASARISPAHSSCITSHCDKPEPAKERQAMVGAAAQLQRRQPWSFGLRRVQKQQPDPAATVAQKPAAAAAPATIPAAAAKPAAAATAVQPGLVRAGVLQERHSPQPCKVAKASPAVLPPTANKGDQELTARLLDLHDALWFGGAK